MMKRPLLFALALLAPAQAFAQKPLPAKSLPIRVVVVTAFEIGEDTGDMAGEFQAWASRIPQKLPFPAGDRALRYDPRDQVLVVSTGMGTGRAAAATMALGLDPRFDLRHSYWLVAAIAGANPDNASAGSAAWIGNVIDLDFGYEIDPREAPAGWPTGRVPWDRTSPYEKPVPQDRSHNLFPLNMGLRDWAYGLTKGVPLPDNDVLKGIRARYAGYPAAQAAPHVLVGDEITGQSFWHGKLLNDHAERWAAYWSGGREPFVMTAMEDSGTLRSIQMLGKTGRVDPGRVMVLRTASNYTMPPPGMDAASSLKMESSNIVALQASLDAAFLVGSRVVKEISSNWARYAAHVPGSVEQAKAE